ncbi:protein kinase domain-containing protein [Dethiosulfatarculus sandiegensis]|uniref:Protein kinase domain-containing protein n=1 Tax=Dethiosulfatarculus sandiegensis TaxID=1429043 RepID=A0A0D2G8D7_9BACT|nr:serine/threonine-protein kinase [Dethiosulfatarculus sandiegensis]KIX11212.1 hypothetical protein X474_25450 [Dethiosulfatarculus sandiegensis]
MEFLDRYRIIRLLGQGAFGSVYLARHPELGVLRAIKLLHQGVANDALLTEAVNQASLEHPNIVQVFDTGRHEEQPFIVMEYLSGGSLQEILQKGPLGLDRALAISVDLASALEHAEAGKVIHRDIKPANVLLHKNHAAKLGDFGLARLFAGKSSQKTKVAGTVAYLSPEQLQGQITFQSDLWALGCLMVEMLSGEPPFGREDNYAAMKRICEAKPVFPDKMRGRLPGELLSLVQSLLQKEPGRRPQNAGQVKELLLTFSDPRTPALDAGRQATMLEEDWPCFQGNPGRTGSVSGAPSPSLKKVWQYEAGAPLFSSPALCRGRAFFGSTDGRIHALDLLTGSSLWTSQSRGHCPTGVIAFGAGVVAITYDGLVYALKASDGELIWRNQVKGGCFTTAPWFTRQGVLVLSKDGLLVSLSLVDGKVNWSHNFDSVFEAGLLWSENQIVTIDSKGLVRALDPEKGEYLWQVELGCPVEAAPCARKGRLFVQGLTGRLFCLDTITGARQWSHDLKTLAPAAPAVQKDKVVAVGANGQVVCLDAVSGQARWQTGINRAVTASPALAFDSVVILDRKGCLTLLEGQGGEKLSQIHLGAPFHSSPVIRRDMVLALDTSGRVFALA